MDLAHFQLDLLKIGITMLILACVNPTGYRQDPVRNSFWVEKPEGNIIFFTKHITIKVSYLKIQKC